MLKSKSILVWRVLERVAIAFIRPTRAETSLGCEGLGTQRTDAHRSGDDSRWRVPRAIRSSSIRRRVKKRRIRTPIPTRSRTRTRIQAAHPTRPLTPTPTGARPPVDLLANPGFERKSRPGASGVERVEEGQALSGDWSLMATENGAEQVAVGLEPNQCTGSVAGG